MRKQPAMPKSEFLSRYVDIVKSMCSVHRESPEVAEVLREQALNYEADAGFYGTTAESLRRLLDVELPSFMSTFAEFVLEYGAKRVFGAQLKLRFAAQPAAVAKP